MSILFSKSNPCGSHSSHQDNPVHCAAFLCHCQGQDGAKGLPEQVDWAGGVDPSQVGLEKVLTVGSDRLVEGWNH